jgi:hypothetical protein
MQSRADGAARGRAGPVGSLSDDHFRKRSLRRVRITSVDRVRVRTAAIRRAARIFGGHDDIRARPRSFNTQRWCCALQIIQLRALREPFFRMSAPREPGSRNKGTRREGLANAASYGELPPLYASDGHTT